ncbi:hypothetical protein [Flammeovirga aprica]|uniref:Uncharacterized protein n=1 Tax=Flammeovirga aprica JL-4 TaxID=694437 RepID=A0A7X9P098_9BACT|nr:hypothetical protein [Flammeovirga aprica]NME67196.1 hypothetical protein [Flammeovirga aprica JL-4]
MSASKKDKELELLIQALQERVEVLENIAGLKKSGKEEVLKVPDSFEHNNKKYTFSVVKFSMRGESYITSKIAENPKQYEEVLGTLEEIEASIIEVVNLASDAGAENE